VKKAVAHDHTKCPYMASIKSVRKRDITLKTARVPNTSTEGELVMDIIQQFSDDMKVRRKWETSMETRLQKLEEMVRLGGMASTSASVPSGSTPPPGPKRVKSKRLVPATSPPPTDNIDSEMVTPTAEGRARKRRCDV